MLVPGGPATAEITVVGAGFSLIGGTLKTTIARDEVLELALDGFLPPCDLNDKPQQDKQSVFRELGLPFVSDPAITRHLAAFLSTAPEAQKGIDAILFNGGFFIPAVFRDRVRDVVEHWYGRRPQVFENQDLDLAVAVGAAYYGYARTTGSGVLVRGGLPRAYFLGLQEDDPQAVRAVCLVPRGSEEGQEIRLEQTDLQLAVRRCARAAAASSCRDRREARGLLQPSQELGLIGRAPQGLVLRHRVAVSPSVEHCEAREEYPSSRELWAVAAPRAAAPTRIKSHGSAYAGLARSASRHFWSAPIHDPEFLAFHPVVFLEEGLDLGGRAG